MPNPAALRARRTDRRRRGSSPCAGKFFRRIGAISPIVRGLRAGPPQGAVAPPALRRRAFVSSLRSWQHLFVPAARFCARGLHRCFTHPEPRGGRSAEKRSGACEAPVGRIMTRYARRLARRLASHDAGRSPLGAPPWRFWALGPRFRLPHYTGAAQRAPRSQVVVPGGRGPAPPGANGYEPPPQDATPRSAFGIVSRTRPQ